MKPNKKKGEKDEIGIECGRRLAAYRKEKGWNQEQLASQLGWDSTKSAQEQPLALSPSRIANYEQGTRRIGLEEARKFATLFDMPAAYFQGSITEHEAMVLKALAHKPGPFPGSPVAENSRAASSTYSNRRRVQRKR